eukprot:4871482-Amphidinium_carterae.1
MLARLHTRTAAITDERLRRTEAILKAREAVKLQQWEDDTLQNQEHPTAALSYMHNGGQFRNDIQLHTVWLRGTAEQQFALRHEEATESPLTVYHH